MTHIHMRIWHRPRTSGIQKESWAYPHRWYCILKRQMLLMTLLMVLLMVLLLLDAIDAADGAADDAAVG
jgi:hypothetical protein